MSERKDKTVEIVDCNRVFLDEKDGSLFFIKKIETYPFLLINSNGDSVYGKDPIKTEKTHVTPESLGYTKKATYDIFVCKTEKDELEDRTVYYSMTLTFEIPSEARYKTAYFTVAKSGRVSLRWFDSGCTSEVSINDPEFCKRGKAKRLPENTVIQKNAPIFTLSASGELERRLDSEAVW